MKTNELIQNLSKSNTPVKVVRFNYLDLLKVFGVGILCIGSMVSILGLRTDISDKTVSVSFIFESLILLTLGILSSASAFTLSIPGNETRKTLMLPLVTLALWLALTAYSFIMYGASIFFIGFGFSCALDVFLISLPPASVLFFLIRKAAPLKRERVGFLVLLAGASYGAFGVGLTCVDDSPIHILIWHLIPSLAIAGAGIFIGKKLLNKI